MRSWVLSIIGGLLAVLLWKAAQTLRVKEGFKSRDEFAEAQSSFTRDMSGAGKKLEDPEDAALTAAVEAGAKRGDYEEPVLILNRYRAKYLTGEDRIGKLTELVDDARKRISTIEDNLKAREKEAAAAAAKVPKID